MKPSWWLQALIIFGLIVAGVELVSQLNCYAQDGLKVADLFASDRCLDLTQKMKSK